MFISRGMQDDIDAARDIGHPVQIADIAENEFHPFIMLPGGGGVKQCVLVVIQPDDATGTLRSQLYKQFTSDGPAGARQEHCGITID